MAKKTTKNPGQETAPTTGQLLLYRTDDGDVKIDVRLEGETVWLTQADMARLFQCSTDNISLHLKNIYDEGELVPEATTEDFSVVRQEGARQIRRNLTFYNLDAVISVGYRVKSAVATRFRIWATERIREFIVKGFVLDDERLKEPEGGRYFEELLARIRDIRSSEKIFWRKVLDIYATSIDYDPGDETSRRFFQQVQNKMHGAAHGYTAAELIHQRADASEHNMGITNFSGKKLLKRDVEVAKNYLSEEELDVLNRIVSAYLELAEIQALNRTQMTMNDWIERLHQFLTLTGRELLTHAGTVSHEAALTKAHAEYEKLRQRQLEAPTEVERHFIAAEAEWKQIEASGKNRGK
ncbi:MAG: virulence RhuM family protein [Gammaproteobacteria bacterium]|nr:virulence RhuM family protein [Gammaproteobacteria bacterium]NNJ83584.1 virulence RhuM family protein [Gammaproteobacteria bacterium]